MIKQKKIFFAGNLRFQKQTFRNRACIYGPNGKLLLVIPIVHDKKKGDRTDSEVQIFNQNHWKTTHWRSLCTSYRSSPYFEYYEDKLHPLYLDQSSNLFDFNLHLIRTICDFLSFDLDYRIIRANKHQHHPTEWLLNAKNENEISLNQYAQVFDNKYGFIPNLSIVDLLFNLGPDSLIFLNKVKVETN